MRHRFAPQSHTTVQMSLEVGTKCANSVGFRWSSSLLPDLCPLCVPKAGYMGYIRKALEMGYLEHTGLHAVLTTCLRFSSVLDGACVSCCLFLSTGSYHVCIQIYIICFPGCTGGVGWVQVHAWGALDDPKIGLQKKRPLRSSESGVPCGCMQVAANGKYEPSLPCCQAHAPWPHVPIHKQGDVCPNGVPALVEGGNNDDDLDSE